MTLFKMGRNVKFLPCVLLLVAVATASSNLYADTVSFLVDPDTIDANNDGFITGSEFQPVGSDGTIFFLEPTNNLVGMNRFLLSDTTGLHFGGGGGSTLEFDFSVSRDLTLDAYTLSSNGFFLGNPFFDIRQDVNLLSTGNSAMESGDTLNFVGGPISIEAGTVYTFEVTAGGAAVQSFLESWTYTSAVPEPSALAALSLAGLVISIRRRRY